MIMVYRVGLKAHFLLKKNIDTLLHKRGHSRRELAAYCRRSESWLSQIFTNEDRNVPLKYLDRIADFFGLATFQLFQPGISPLTERRTGQERRSGQDRRISAARRDLPTTPVRQLSVSPDDEQILAELHALDYETYQRVKGWITVARLGRPGADTERKTPPRGAPPGEAVGRSGRGHGAPRKRRKPKKSSPQQEPPTGAE